MNSMSSRRGFTILEIAVVVGIIALLAAFAVPNLLRNRMNAAEAVVVGSCQTIGQACQNFYARALPHSYPETLAELSTGEPAYLDPILGSGQKQGYRFLYSRLDTEHFQLEAQPITQGWHGNHYFFLDESGVLRSRDGTQAGPTDPPIGGG